MIESPSATTQGWLPDQRRGTEHRVPQPQLPALPRVKILHVPTFELQIAQLLLATRFPQIGCQLLVDVKMLLDRRLAMRR